MGCLHGQGHADTERGQRHHWCGPYSDEHHLSKNWRQFEKLSSERGDEHPVEQTKIKLEIIFQRGCDHTQNAKRAELTKAEKITPSPIARRLGAWLKSIRVCGIHQDSRRSSARSCRW